MPRVIHGSDSFSSTPSFRISTPASSLAWRSSAKMDASFTGKLPVLALTRSKSGWQLVASGYQKMSSSGAKRTLVIEWPGTGPAAACRLAATAMSACGTTAISGPVASGKLSAGADIEVGWVLLPQCGGLLTVAASSSRMVASCISELTLSRPTVDLPVA
jgi:hypothetical protein